MNILILNAGWGNTYMNSETDRRKLNDNAINILIITSIILVIATLSTGYLGLFVFIGVSVLIAGTVILLPLKNYIREGTLRSGTAVLAVFLRTVFVLMLIVSGYEILFSKNYNLKYSYWIAAICIIYMFTVPAIQGIIKDLKEKKYSREKLKGLFSIGGTVLWILIVIYFGYNLTQSYLLPIQQINLSNLKMPNKIVVYKQNKDAKSSEYLSSGSICEITSSENIEKIIKELKSAKIENISSYDLANYYRMKKNNYPCYTMFFQYSNTDNALRGIENGYIQEVVITSNRSIVIQQLNSRHGLIFQDYYEGIYPVSLSKDTIDMIFSFIEVKKDK